MCRPVSCFHPAYGGVKTLVLMVWPGVLSSWSLWLPVAVFRTGQHVHQTVDVNVRHHPRRNHATHEVDDHVHGHRITQFAGAHVHVAEHKTQCECVEELEQVHVHQSKEQRGEHDRGFFAVFARAADEFLAEDPFFEQRSENYEEHHVPHVELHGQIAHRIAGFASGQQRRQHIADETAPIHEREAHDKQFEELARLHVELACFNDRRFAHDQYRERHGHEIQRGIRCHIHRPIRQIRGVQYLIEHAGKHRCKRIPDHHHQAHACADAGEHAFHAPEPKFIRIGLWLRILRLLLILGWLLWILLRMRLLRPLRILGVLRKRHICLCDDVHGVRIRKC